MGIVIFVVNAVVHIPQENFAAAFAAIRALAGRETCLIGQDAPHFSFVSREATEQAKDLYELLSAWRWLPMQDDDSSDIESLDFLGEKIGDEDLLFQAIAPFVRSGSYITCVNDEGNVWRWYFTNGTVAVQEGRIVF